MHSTTFKLYAVGFTKNYFAMHKRYYKVQSKESIPATVTSTISGFALQHMTCTKDYCHKSLQYYSFIKYIFWFSLILFLCRVVQPSVIKRTL